MKYHENGERDKNGYYWLDGELYPSVTTVLKGTGKKFRAGDRAKIGSIVHYHILQKYADRLLPIPCEPIWNLTDDQVYFDLKRAVQMWEMLDLDSKIETVAVEQTVYFKDGAEFDFMRYAGRVDHVFRYDDEVVLCDLKTGDIYNNYFLQVAAYAMAVEFWLKIKVDTAWIVQIDLNLDRNPDSLPSVIVLTKLDLLNYCSQFLDTLEHFSNNFMKKK